MLLPAALLFLATACAHRGQGALGERAEDALDSAAIVRLTDPDGSLLGEANLSGDPRTWRLVVEVAPPEGATGWRGFVVRGECANPTGQVVELSSFAAAGAGVESVTVFPRAWLKPGTRYAVTVRDEGGAASACGEIGEIGAATSATGR